MTLKQIVKKILPLNLYRKIEPYGHLLEAMIINLFNGFPGRKLKVIGVTGTNGKTTTTSMIYKMLLSSGYKVGLMSTIEWGINEDIHLQHEHYTNVPVNELMSRLKLMKKAKVDWLVYEVTSHGLAQNRVWGVPFSVAVITNISHEHLDYHRTFENYLQAKRKLFTLANKNKRGLRAGVVNADDPNLVDFAKSVQNPITYGIQSGEMKAVSIEYKTSGSKYKAMVAGETYEINCHIPGSFNVYNSLASVATGRIIGLNKEQIEKGIDSLKSVSGRMTRIDEGQDFDVIVDFAHSPDSFEKLFKDLKPVLKGRLIVMFGSPGRRDEAKRFLQGDLAGKYADLVILTEEDDRDVDGYKILDQIVEGVTKHGKVKDKDMFVVHDRVEAIKFTLSLGRKDDTILLLGKGHEQTIERADGAHPWNEIATTRKLLKELLKEKPTKS
ncbi:MAG TPA: UDP-N-acetylmuramoyl-L-alanyl-D-glutamate--2,6-diaminopimelate ligase [Patescibacteria group bacterium]|nr:UDP-N-acetylmuramoyl-L-alanyl-D-glutamate--2,6-diaminopimelate ligase [Patescibacteria group bacterium]